MAQFSVENFLGIDRGQFSFRQLFERIFIDDWLMKLIALVITLALWLGVTGLSSPTEERLRGVELKLKVANNMEITNSPYLERDLVLVGDKRKIDQIRREDLNLFLDMVDSPPGERTLELNADTVNIQLPTGVKLQEIQPSTISVKLEMVESRDLTVKAETVGDVPDGYEVYGISVVPPKVPARGPASYINSIDYISTDKIDLNDKRADFTAQQVPLNITNPKVTVTDETTVDVFFRIGERRIERLFIVPVIGDREKRTATVVLFGARSLLNSLRSEDIRVELETTDAGEESLGTALPAAVQGQVEIRKSQINGR